jgi:hypothetical protein
MTHTEQSLKIAIEYADARWSGVDVPIEWARHFADAIGKLYTTPPAAQPAQQCLDCGSNNIGIPATYDSLIGSVKTPQQRPWVGLTEAQFWEAARLAGNGNYLVAFVHIQEWLKEGNI